MDVALAKTHDFAHQAKSVLSGVWGAAGQIGAILRGGGSLGGLAGLAAMSGLGAVAASAAAGLESVRQTLADINTQARQAQMLGANFQQFQVLAHLAPDVETLTTGLFHLQRFLGEAAYGSASAQQALSHLGLTLGQLQQLSSDRQFALIADALNRIQSPAERSVLMFEIFGRGAQQLTGVLSRGSQGIAQAREEMERMGLLIGPEAVLQARQANQAFRQMDVAMRGAWNTIAVQLAPVVVTAANHFRNLAHRLNELAGVVSRIVALIPQSSGPSPGGPGGGGYFTSGWNWQRIAWMFGSLGISEHIGIAQNAIAGGNWIGPTSATPTADSIIAQTNAALAVALGGNTAATVTNTAAVQAEPVWVTAMTHHLDQQANQLLQLQLGGQAQAQIFQATGQLNATAALPGQLAGSLSAAAAAPPTEWWQQMLSPLQSILAPAATDAAGAISAGVRARQQELALMGQKLLAQQTEIQALQRHSQLMQQGASITASLRSPLEVFQDRLAELNRLQEAGALTGAAFQGAQAQAFAQLQQQFQAPQTGVQAALEGSAAAASAIARYNRQTDQVDVQQQIRDLMRTATDSAAATEHHTAEIAAGIAALGIVRPGR